MWAAAQVLSSASGLEIAIAVAALVVIIYTMYGGLLADVVTDAVQGVALMIGLLLLLYGVLEAGGGIEASVWETVP